MQKRKSKKQRDAEFLNSDDISFCQRCGDSTHIWHCFGTGEMHDEVVGMCCTRCFWTCGTDNIFTALMCKWFEIKIFFEKLKRRNYHG